VSVLVLALRVVIVWTLACLLLAGLWIVLVELRRQHGGKTIRRSKTG
jgi:hypothetical protein